MKINKNVQRSQHTLRRRPSSTSPNLLHAFRIFLLTLICMLLAAVVLFSAFHSGKYITEVFISRTLRRSYTVAEMEAHFQCEEAFASTRSWWTSDQWREVRDLYRYFAKKNRVGTYQMAEDITFDLSEIAEPFQAGEEKGRGLRAARDIRKGENVFRMTNNTIVFIDGLTYRKFLFALEELFPTFACDIMNWNWMEDLDDDGVKFGIAVDLSDSNLVNTADEEEDVNVRCGELGKEDSCDMTFYATRYIRKGEELVTDYDDFVSPSHTFDEMGL
ncbi:hypothetical protein ACHAWT_007289 [Skeletonema menzelii]